MHRPLFPARPDRRVFVQGLGLVSVGLVAATLGACESLAERIRNRPTRRRIGASEEVDDMLEIFGDAVEAMKALPASNPRSWSAQAGIHGTEVPDDFNHCQHGTGHFFSWHRAYLGFFEQICREVTGDPSFALPYWNWNLDRDVPSAFTSSSSKLFHATRDATTLGTAPQFDDSVFDTIFGSTNFFTFSTQLEGQPHNFTHTIINGTMSTGGSPLDPVFWVHHCMVDYCWYKWNVELGRDNPGDASWTGETWDHFVDGDGDPAEITAGATALFPLLSYQYESSAIGSHAATSMAMTAAEVDELDRRLKEGADVRFEVTRRIRFAERIELSTDAPFSRGASTSAADMSALIDNDASREQLFASIEYADLPTRSDFYVRVFLNRPDATPETPIEDPHYAGSFAFFGTRSGGGHAGGHHHHAPRFLVNVTDTVRRLRERGALSRDEELTLQLVAVPLDPQAGPVTDSLTLTAADLIVTPVLIREG